MENAGNCLKMIWSVDIYMYEQYSQYSFSTLKLYWLFQLPSHTNIPFCSLSLILYVRSYLLVHV